MLRRYCPVLVVVSLALVVAAAPAAAEEPADPACNPVVAALGPGSLDAAWLFAAPQAKGGSIEGPGEQAVCNALCNDGSYVTCWGTSCSAVDANCPNQRGYCWGSSTGYRYCPTCPSSCQSPCSASAQCSDGSWVSCDGCTGDCFSVHECYAYCDGTYHWCPNPGGGLECPI